MILVDTSVWIDHWRQSNARFESALNQGLVVTHLLVLGEIACGNIRHRSQTLELLDQLPQVVAATHGEAFTFVTTHRIWGKGIGWIDAHLLASAKIAGCLFWTLDRRVNLAAKAAGVTTIEQP